MAFTYDKVPYFRTGNLTTYQFLHSNIATSAASTAMTVADTSGVTQFAMPYDGYILATAGANSAALTAGTIRVIPSINGATITAGVATNAATGVRVVYATVVGPNAYDTSTLKFSAGDRLGCKLSTTATYAPNTAEWNVGVTVEFRPAQ